MTPTNTTPISPNTTRRKIITGIAGILATSTAPAYITKSLIGARENILLPDEGDTPTPADYVQDGLLAMWDGEWNDGEGVHSTSSDGWYDLIGNISFSGESDLSFAAKGLETSVGMVLTSSSNPFGSTYPTTSTFEFVCRPMSNDGGGALGWTVLFDVRTTTSASAAFGKRSNYKRGFRMNYLSPYEMAVNDGANLTVGDLLYGAYVTDGSSRHGYFARASGVLVDASGANQPTSQKTGNLRIGGLTGNWGGMFEGLFFAIRCYSRALTKDEIAYKYSIDKARFNLP